MDCPSGGMSRTVRPAFARSSSERSFPFFHCMSVTALRPGGDGWSRQVLEELSDYWKSLGAKSFRSRRHVCHSCDVPGDS